MSFSGGSSLSRGFIGALLVSSLHGGCKARESAPMPSSQVTNGPSSHGTTTVPPSASAIPPTFETLKLVLTGTRPPCNAADCHGPGGPNPLKYPVNDGEALYAVLTHYVSKECGNIPVVTPGDPKRSALVKVLKGPCSSKVPQMPNGCTPEADNCLPAEYVAAIERWIALGAPKQ